MRDIFMRFPRRDYRIFTGFLMGGKDTTIFVVAKLRAASAASIEARLSTSLPRY